MVKGGNKRYRVTLVCVDYHICWDIVEANCLVITTRNQFSHGKEIDGMHSAESEKESEKIRRVRLSLTQHGLSFHIE